MRRFLTSSLLRFMAVFTTAFTAACSGAFARNLGAAWSLSDGTKSAIGAVAAKQ